MQKYFLLLLFFLCISCGGTSRCNGVEEIYVPKTLQVQASRTAFPYCNQLLKARNEDAQALQKLIRFAYKTNDESAIEHGIVFSELLLLLGDEYCYAFFMAEEEDMQLLAAKMIDACLEYRDPPLALKEELPKTFDLLLGQYGLGEK